MEKSTYSPTQLNLLLLYYNFANNEGVVNMDKVADWLEKNRGVTIRKTPVRITQTHIDLLIEYGLIPNTTALFDRLRQKSG